MVLSGRTLGNANLSLLPLLALALAAGVSVASEQIAGTKHT